MIKIIEKNNYKPFSIFVENVLKVLKSENQCQIEKKDLTQLLEYLDKKKIGKIEFTIIFSTAKKYITVFSYYIEECKTNK